MKITVKLALAFLVLSIPSTLRAFDQNPIATSTGTVFTVAATTNAAVLVSTGARLDYTIFVPTGTTVTPGQIMAERKHIEIFNDSDRNIWIGFDVNLSTITGSTNRGRRIPTGASLSLDSSLTLWFRSDASTTKGVCVTQEK